MRSGEYFILINDDIQTSVIQNPTEASLIRSGIISGMITAGNDCTPITVVNETNEKLINGIQFTTSTFMFHDLSNI